MLVYACMTPYTCWIYGKDFVGSPHNTFLYVWINFLKYD